MKAVVFVDVQKDFIDGVLKNEKAIEVVPKIVEFAKECVKNDYKIYATRDTHKKTVYANIHRLNGTVDANVPWNGYLASLEGQKLPVEHCIEGTDGWMIDERLWNVIEGKATVINKPTFGSFDLAEVIKEDVVYWNGKDYYDKTTAWDDKNYFDDIIIVGFVTSICVLANAVLLRAKFPNTKIAVMKDLCAGITVEDHAAALKCLEMQQIEVI